ncbi:MAG TPA: carotenoid biosynthesis protein, partial [Nitrospira sp.]|nr:carotenoid biosynthesis protein [Nitrospira sp.]
YPDPGVHYGVPMANYAGWAVVGALSLLIYFSLDRRLASALPPQTPSTTHRLLLGVGLYYGVLIFNLAVTFWVGESLQGTTGLLMYVPVTAILVLRVLTPAPPAA